MKKDDMNAVLNATMQLPDSARIALGRMAGVSLRSAMTSTRGRNAKLSFMALFPPEVYEKTSKFEQTILFFSCCSICAQDRNENSMLVEKYLSSVYNDPDTTDSEKSRIRAMIAENITLTGNFLKHLSAYIKRGQREGFKFNMYTLTSDLMYWNHATGLSREKWARAILRVTPDAMNAVEEEDNQI